MIHAVSRPAPASSDMDPTAVIARLEASVSSVVRGKDDVVRFAVVALLADGHVLIEDVPGVGKTTLARALARSLGLEFQRIQFTSDLLPSDILGIQIYRQSTETFEFQPGPLFTNVLLADEINRATPKTQSALLEAMSERRVSVERERLRLPQPFLVLATQNPVEYLGTFPLPESQLDRFLMSLEMGYPAAAHERELLMSGGVQEILEDLDAAVTPQEILQLRDAARRVRVDEKIVDYVLAIAHATRESGDFDLPVSTRGVQGLYRAVQALALCDGRDYAIPDDVQALARPVLAHRVVLHRGSGRSEEARAAIGEVLRGIPVPV